MSSKLFVFNRDLPAPFDKLRSKKVSAHSKYSEDTEPTLSPTVVKAVMAFCSIKGSTGLGAIGMQDTKIITEYKSTDDDKYHLVVYDSVNPHLSGREDTEFPKDFPMLERKDQTKIYRDKVGDVIIYTTLGNSADIIHEINLFLIRETQEKQKNSAPNSDGKRRKDSAK